MFLLWCIALLITIYAALFLKQLYLLPKQYTTLEAYSTNYQTILCSGKDDRDRAKKFREGGHFENCYTLSLSQESNFFSRCLKLVAQFHFLVFFFYIITIPNLTI